MNSLALIPEYILLGSAGLVFLWNLVREKDERGVLAIGTLGCVLAFCFSLAKIGSYAETAFFSAFTVDSFTTLFRLLASCVGILVLAGAARDPKILATRRAEFYALILTAVAAIQILAGATELITIFVGLEMLSIASFVLVAFQKESVQSAEAGLKFFLFGVASVGILLYGFSLLLGMTGTSNLVQIAEHLKVSGASPLLWTVLILILSGFGFKVLMAPFHMWGPDVYEGAPTSITNFLAVGSKAGGFAVLLRVLLVVFGSFAKEWVFIIAILAALTMLVGNVLAISQKNIKRMLAYSSIAHGGYLLMGLAALASVPWGIPGLLFYLLGYIFVTSGAFLVVIAVSRETGIGSDAIDDYAGLSQRAPYLAASLTVFFLSLIGIPPLVGFFGKYLLFGAVIQQGMLWLAIVGVLNSVISVGYYIPVVRNMYLLPPRESLPVSTSRPIVYAVTGSLVLTILLGIYPDPIFQFVRSASAALGIGI